MEKMVKCLLLAMLLVLVLPAVCMRFLNRKTSIEQAENTESSLEASEPDLTQQTFKHSRSVKVLMSDQTVRQMELEEYLCGVVLAEMPVTFQEDALKAQAVVARTYTCKRIKGNGKHENAAVCTDSACCQAYIDPDDYLHSSGTTDALNKVKQVVNQTAGQVLLYNGNLIEATYFSCSGGRTESALAVWGSDIPYLQSIESPGEEIAVHYTDTVTFDIQTFADKLGIAVPDDGDDWIGAVTYTDGGGVDKIEIGGRTFTGAEIRTMLKIRSTAFTVTAGMQTVEITTKGFGHRVGMSQYGAQAMALQGYDYKQILSYYYSGTNLEEIDWN